MACAGARVISPSGYGSGPHTEHAAGHTQELQNQNQKLQTEVIVGHVPHFAVKWTAFL